MPSPARSLALGDVAGLVEAELFGDTGACRTGLELEWLTCTPEGHRPALADLERLCRDVAPTLPRGGRLTIEPGGQLELSTVPFDDPAAASEAAATDLFVLDEECRRRGIDLVALGADPVRRPRCLRDGTPRYAAMATYFGRRWPAAARMMANSASIQLNVGNGCDDGALRRRWRLAHQLGPTLTAAFANSPFADGTSSGWQSTRSCWWDRIDPARTRPLDGTAHPAAAWTEYALGAPVLLFRLGDGGWEPGDPDLPFGRWIVEGHELGWPTLDDLRYHLTTLFPPVRPRGWLELRYLDALPTPFWHVAASVVTAVLDDEALGAAAGDALAGSEHLWVDAAQLGLAHPVLGRAARQVFALVLEHLAHSDPDGAAEAVVGTYHELWVARGRTPADDRLDHWRRTGEILPRAESPIPYAAFETVRP